MILLDGLATSKQIKQEIAAEVRQLQAQGHRVPHLAAVLIGENGASLTYVNAKVKACEEVGFQSTLVQRSADISEVDLLKLVDELNNNPDIDGYIIQLPLPKHINEHRVLLAIHPEKDVDGFHPENVGRMALGLPCYLPATPAGILELLKRYQVPTAGKHCVVIGRSHIVGLPMSILLQRNANPGNCTVTITHSKTTNLPELCREADIIVAALGKPEFLTADMVKEGAAVIDVGITRVPDSSKKSGFRLAGDVDFAGVSPKCSFITPVPGGVGPMTIVSLLMNTLEACKRRI
ncbi:MAG: bifunctional 5,10-methylenetetrahydrofolate dehydrogenase/5,10-methenyltetrahydrofolate cyclohydrolase [Flavobacteriales bacterium]|jgi:methylenetetrahydrofolate dehydrogenase (NADP+)/methenyltetrahydrofolate cyclohydrolase